MKPNSSLTIIETTQGDLLHYLIGVSNIWVRDLPDTQGKPEPRLSANLTIFDRDTEEANNQKVFVGSIIQLDDEKYRVTEIKEGSTTPGSLTLQRIS